MQGRISHNGLKSCNTGLEQREIHVKLCIHRGIICSGKDSNLQMAFSEVVQKGRVIRSAINFMFSERKGEDYHTLIMK